MTHTKLTVNLTPKAASALDNTAELTGDRKTDIVNRALQMYEWLELEKVAGMQLLMRNPDTGETKEIRWL